MSRCSNSPILLWCILLINIPLCVIAYQNYNITVRLPRAFGETITLFCPEHYAQPGDQVSFYRSEPGHLQSVLVHTASVTSETEMSSQFTIPVERATTGTTLYCEIQRQEANEISVVSYTWFYMSKNSGFTNLFFESQQSKKVYGKLGDLVHLSCNTEGDIVWFRLPGYRVLTGDWSDLKFEHLQRSDIGTYYCTNRNAFEMNTNSLPVQRIDLIAEPNTAHYEKNLSKFGEESARYQCQSLLTTESHVTWNGPLGTVLVGANDRINAIPQRNQPMRDSLTCQSGGISSQNDRLRRERRATDNIVRIEMLPRDHRNDKEVKLKCIFMNKTAEGQTLTYKWLTPEKEAISTEQEITQTIELFTESNNRRKSISCQVESTETGEVLGSANFYLEPKPIQLSKTSVLEASPEMVYSYLPGEMVELACHVDRKFADSGDEAEWTLNSGPIPEGVLRRDHLTVTRLIIQELDASHEGIYRCKLADNSFFIQLIQRPIELELEVHPETDTRWANAGEATEFHCRFDGVQNGNTLIDWYFTPNGTTDETNLHSDITVERPVITPATSFITIMNVQKYHEGHYTCKAMNLSSVAELKVLTRDLSVTPSEVDARPGTAVRFLCELSSVPGLQGGKVYWMRTDRKALQSGKEEVIGSSGGRALLIVNNVDWSDHNVTYMCTDGINSAYAQLYVREACGPGYRSCASRECIEAYRFCDGTPDCADGSDELVSKCQECEPNEFRCEANEGKAPTKNCYLQFWHCDGEDDCGNNFDEANCPPPSPNDQCNGTHFICPSSHKAIPRSFMCDGWPDCEEFKEDEEGCSAPVIIEPTTGTNLIGLESSNLVLTCVSYGRPPPAINWRFNWGPIRDGVKYEVNTTVIDCNKVVSHLTLFDLQPEASGLYTCEAVNKGRTLSPDISVNYAKGGICTPPMFNDGALLEDLCLKCYCSNVTSNCRSARGYMKSPSDKTWTITGESDTILRGYVGKNTTKTNEGIQINPDFIRVSSVPADNYFLESSFGLNGSWLSSYGYKLKFVAKLFGPSLSYMHGAIASLHSTDKSMFWCAPKDRVLLYSIPLGYKNTAVIHLTERDRWYHDVNCTQRLDPKTGRSQFMGVLRDVKRVGVRARVYNDQDSMEIKDMSLEYVKRSDRPGVWVTEIEQCECPVGYDGLSCEKCATGYEVDPSNPNTCRPKCACDSCDSKGNCLDCAGYRVGPRCQHCQAGFYRPRRSPLSEDCIACDRCDHTLPHLAKECLVGSGKTEDPYCKCEVAGKAALLDPECDRCEIAKALNLPPPEDAECEKKPEPTKCNWKGTQSTDGSGACTCKVGYGGDLCDECDIGYFQEDQQCHKCYCSGQTESCRLSDNHYFLNITMNENYGYLPKIWLAQRTVESGLEKVDFTPNNEPRLEETAQGVIVRHPLNERGVIHLGLQLTSPPPTDKFQSDVPVYRYLYGGQMSFRLDSVELDPKLLTQGEASVIVEIESTRFGRVWARAVFNTITQRYEVEFDELWWPGGWRLGTPDAMEDIGPVQGLNRGQLMRVLATTSSIAIVTSSGDSFGLRGMRLIDLAVQIAAPLTDDSIVDRTSAKRAPVELCDCPMAHKPGERMQSLSCEGCRNMSEPTVVHMGPGKNDLTCGRCTGPSCEDCPSGQFKYDVLSGKEYTTCQTGLKIDSNRRYIVAEVGSSINLVCRATSYRGAVATHAWLPIDITTEDSSRLTTKRIKLTPGNTGPLLKQPQFNQSIHRSESTMTIQNVRKEDSGIYRCRAATVGSIVESDYYVTVRDKGEPPSVAEDDKLNKQYYMPLPWPGAQPKLTDYRMEPDPSNRSTVIISGKVKNPSDLWENHLIWKFSNGTSIPMEITELDRDTGSFRIQLAVPHAMVESGNTTLTGFFIGKDPIHTPYWINMRQPDIVPGIYEKVSTEDIILPPSEITIPFMEPETIRVHVKPGVTPIRVEWTRVDDLPEAISDKEPSEPQLPLGVVQEGDDLKFFGAAKQHEGIYQGIVYRGSDSEELLRFNTTVRVQPLNRGESTHLGPGEAKDIPTSPMEGEVTTAPTEAPPVWDYLVQGFTPEAEYCQQPKWELVDYQTKRVIDVTELVERLSASNFRVDYPLTSGVYLRFTCQPVPMANLTGEIKFNITSSDPRIIFHEVYDNPNSTFPTRLVCMDLNPTKPSQLNITAETMNNSKISDALITMDDGRPDKAIRKVELDWRRVGEFDPFNDAGRFTCLASNAEVNGSRTILVPSDRISVPEDYKQVYVYSPDAFVSPEEDGVSVIRVEEGSQLRIYCHFDARPASNFSGWKTDSQSVQSSMELITRQYSSLARTENASLSLNQQMLKCNYGDKAKQLKLIVTPKGQTKTSVRIVSDALVDDRLLATTGGDIDLTCDVQHTGNGRREISRIDWFVQYANGLRRSATKTTLAQSILLSGSGNSIHFKNITNKPTGVKIFCVARPVDVTTAAEAYFPSPMVEFWIRKPKLSAHIEPSSRPGFVTGVEGETIMLKCIATDRWRMKPLLNPTITWETKITSRLDIPQNENELTALRPEQSDKPWHRMHESEDGLMIGGLRIKQNWKVEFRCSVKESKTNGSAVSDWLQLEIKPGDTVMKKPRLQIIAETSPEFPFYPTRVECKDENVDFPSQVTWTRQQGIIEQENVESKPNSAVLSWVYDGEPKFHPRTHSDIYTCQSANEHYTVTKQLYIPLDLMPAEPIPASDSKLVITSETNTIEKEGDTAYTRVIAGQPFELVCTFYGHPPPTGGLRWSVKHLKSSAEMGSTRWMAVQGLRVRHGRSYWTHVHVPEFDARGKHTGVYDCEAITQSGAVYKRKQLRVELYRIDVLIAELDDGKIVGNAADDGTITCTATDGYQHFVLPDVKYAWEFERFNGQRMNPDVIASEVIVDGNTVRYKGLSSNAMNVRGRCIAINGTGRYISSDFGFYVKRTPGKADKRTDFEPGVPRMVKGDGSERVLLKVNGVNNGTSHVSLMEGDRFNFTCIAVDSVTSKQLPGDEFNFGWILTDRSGHRIAFDTLASGSVSQSTTEDGRAGLIELEKAKPSRNQPQPTGKVQCLASSKKEPVTYVSSPVSVVVYDDGSTPDSSKERHIEALQSRLTVKVDGLDSRNVLYATEGSTQTLSCTAVDRTTGSVPSGTLSYSWKFMGLDDTPISTVNLVEETSGKVEIDGNKLTIKGIRKTSAVQGYCSVAWRSDATKDEESGQVYYYSPNFRLDVVDRNEDGIRDFSQPRNPVPIDQLQDILLNITGLDESGHLTASTGETAEMKCQALNASTNLPLEETDELKISYGWQFIKLNGMSAASNDIAAKQSMDSKTGDLKLVDLQSQSQSNRTQGRCVVQLSRTDPLDTRPVMKAYATPYFFVNVPSSEEMIPEYVDAERKRYELTVSGLDQHGILQLTSDQPVELKCVIRDVETDTLMDNLVGEQMIGWQLPIYPSGTVGNPADVAGKVISQQDRLTLENVHMNLRNGLRGRCLFFDSTAYYTSPYFTLVVPRGQTDGRVRVEVQDLSVGEEKKYLCAAYDSKTGARLLNVSYGWVFSTSTDEQVMPAYFFRSIEAEKNLLKIEQRRQGMQLPENFRNSLPIVGQCVVYAAQYADDIEAPRVKVYHSDPFIQIDPDTEDPSRMFVYPDPFAKGKRLAAIVEGVENGLVSVPEDGTVTLTCKAIDSNSMEVVDNLTYTWEVQQRDSSPIDTAALAQKAVLVEGKGGRRMTLVGVRSKAGGLRGRCVIRNDTKPLDSQAKQTDLLAPGEHVASAFFDFNVITETKGAEFTGYKEYILDKDSKGYEVVVSGLDEKGRLKLTKGENKTLEVKLRNPKTGELMSMTSDSATTHMGLEVSYDNGQSAPLSSLAESVVVHGKDGIINLNNIHGNSKPPLQMRVIVERGFLVVKEDENGDVVAKKTILRIPSPYIPIVALDEGETEPPVQPLLPTTIIYPVVDGLNRCGQLPGEVGSNVTLTCRPNDTRISYDNLIFGWEVRHAFGGILPPVNLIAKSVRQERNRLQLIGMLDHGMQLIGRCIVAQTVGKCLQFGSPYFGIGTHGEGCGPEEPIVIPDQPGEPVPPGSRYNVLIRITGLDDNGELIADPESNVTLKCTALNATTKEPIESTSIGWSFISDTGETLSGGRLAKISEMTEDNSLNLIGLRENANARGRCWVTLDGRVTMSSMYFKFHVGSESSMVTEPDGPTNSDRRVRVEITGLNERHEISINRVGDDASLRCQAVVLATGTPLQPTQRVHYGWDWRYLDEDAVSSVDVAVAVETNAERLGLRGIRAQPGTKSGNVKGRCVVHVPANQVDSSLPADKTLVYGSEYFTVDLAKKPTTLDPEVFPIPGKDSDGIAVVVHGLDNNGYLSGEVDGSLSVLCEAQNVTTKQRLTTEGAHAEYNVFYGWKFVDVNGRSIDSSRFANSISYDANGNLRMRGLAAPNRGNLPFKLLCTAIVSKRPDRPGQPSGRATSYQSEYFALKVTRLDGASTIDQPAGKPKPDIQGDKYTVKVLGLQPDSSLTAQPGQNVQLECAVTDSLTGERQENFAIGWEFQRSTGTKMNLGLLANSIYHTGDVLRLDKLKRLEGSGIGAFGRCVAYRGQQIYHSNYFKIQIAAVPKGQEVKGDGRILVRVLGVDEGQLEAAILPNKKVKFTCTGLDTHTNQPIPNLKYAWDHRVKFGTDGPELQGSLGSVAKIITETPTGELVLQTASDEKIDEQAKFRCIVYNGTSVYTSKFYKVLCTKTPDVTEAPVPPHYPKYRVVLQGLDSKGRLSGQIGETVDLQCNAYKMDTGEPANDVNYRWNLERTDRGAVSAADLVTESLHLDGDKLTLKGLKATRGTIKGRCEVSTAEDNVWDWSDYFYIYAPPDAMEMPEEEVARPLPFGSKEANATDTRVVVKVSGLDDDGNFVAKTGENVQLKCTAEGDNVQSVSYGWEFLDINGLPIPFGQLAISSESSVTEGTFDLKELKALDGTFKGRCVVMLRKIESVVGLNGEQAEQLTQFRYGSKWFGISITDDGLTGDTLKGVDVQGKVTTVIVEGLTEDGRLYAESGDQVTLKCVAQDSKTQETVQNAVYSWELRDGVGENVPIDKLAQSVIKEHNELQLIHLSPASTNRLADQRFGRCVVFNPATNYLYKSPYFYMDVRKPIINGIVGPNDRVEVNVIGVPDDGVISEKEDQTVVLKCLAFDRLSESKSLIPPNQALYHFQFLEAAEESEDLYGGHVADEIKQERLPDGGVQITLKGIKTKNWHRGRCVVFHIPSGQSIEGEPETTDAVRQYNSNYFWSSMQKQGDRVMTAEELKDKPITINGLTYDPKVLVKIFDSSANNTIFITPGSNETLRCYAMDIDTGKPIDDIEYSWDIRATDDVPVDSNRLAEKIITGSSVSETGQTLDIIGYRPTGDRSRIRCLATATGQMKNERFKNAVFASAMYTIETDKTNEPITVPLPSVNRYDPKMLRLEVLGLNADGTLSLREGENATLECQAVDIKTGIPVDDKLNFGWNVGTGPDARTVPLNLLADDVQISDSKLALSGVRTTLPKSGGLRSRCVATFDKNSLENPEDYTQDSVTIASDTFVIYVKPQEDAEREQRPDDGYTTPYTTWIPGKDPKNAVIVKVFDLETDGSVLVKPGGNLSLSCIALDAVNLRRIVRTQDVVPQFQWEVRTHAGGDILDYAHLANGDLVITQPDMDASVANTGVSRLYMDRMRRTSMADSAVVGRCSVRLRNQVFRSPYFQINTESSEERKYYADAPEDYLSTDGAIKVIVKGLDDDEMITVNEGSDMKLECEAADAKTHVLIPSNQAIYGWQLVNPKTDTIMTPPGDKGKMSGSTMEVKNIQLYDADRRKTVLWGWCQADIKQAESDRMKRYRSKPFKIAIIKKDHPPKKVDEEPILAEVLYVQVKGLSDDGVLKGNEGDTKTLTCQAIDTRSGQLSTSDQFVYGWEWRTMDGGIANPSVFGENFSIDGQTMTIQNLKVSKPLKGRCVVLVRPTSRTSEDTKETGATDLPSAYSSNYFFVEIDSPDTGKESSIKTQEVLDSTDSDVVVTASPVEDGKLKLQRGGETKITTEVETDNPNLHVIEMGYEITYLSGRPAQSGELARQFAYDAKKGELVLKDTQFSTQPIKIRFYALMKSSDPDASERIDDSAEQPLKRYWSEFYPIDVQPEDGADIPKWTNGPHPAYDVTGKAYKVFIEGLDSNGSATGTPKESMELKCKVFDDLDLEAEFDPNSYTWQFVDNQGRPANPGFLADSVEVENGKTLKLKGYRSIAAAHGLQSRCVVSIRRPLPVDVKIDRKWPRTQYYSSPYFKFVIAKETSGSELSTDVTEETPVTTPKSEVTDDVTSTPSEHGFQLRIDTSTSPYFQTHDNQTVQTVLARVQRPFELTCRVVFNEGVGGTTSDTGDALPRLVWYYRQPEIPGDVPIPSQLFPVSPPRMETLGILPQVDYKIKVESDAYSFRDDIAEFHCNAYMDSDKPVAQQIVFIQKIEEKFNVRVFDEDSRNRAYNFLGATKTLTCYVTEIETGERVEPLSYEWQVNAGDGSWFTGSDPRQPANPIGGWETNQLQLDSLKKPAEFSVVEAIYEVRCIAKYNTTFDTISRPFVLTIRDKPEITSIALKREKPTEETLEATDLPEDVYDAAEDYQLKCEPSVIGVEATANWQKCDDDECTTTSSLPPAGDTLFLFANSTRYTNEGRFRCQVIQQLKEYNFKKIEKKDILLVRKAAPAIYSTQVMTYSIDDEMSLQCTDEASSPESNVVWTFEPTGAAPPDRKNPTLIGKQYAYGRIYIFAIARGQLMPEHSGKYTCMATNPSGTSNSTITVSITEDVRRNNWRLRRRIFSQ